MKITNLTLILCFFTLSSLAGLAKPSGGPSAGLEELFPGPILDANGKEVSKMSLPVKLLEFIFPHIGALPADHSRQTWLNFATRTKRISKWFL